MHGHSPEVLRDWPDGDCPILLPVQPDHSMWDASPRVVQAGFVSDQREAICDSAGDE